MHAWSWSLPIDIHEHAYIGRCICTYSLGGEAYMHGEAASMYIASVERHIYMACLYTYSLGGEELCA
tara:strand:- start:67 stop:267 length:201 start_codon:yes stop_codon:yes gene_type:complete